MKVHAIFCCLRVGTFSPLSLHLSLGQVAMDVVKRCPLSALVFFVRREWVLPPPLRLVMSRLAWALSRADSRATNVSLSDGLSFVSLDSDDSLDGATRVQGSKERTWHPPRSRTVGAIMAFVEVFLFTRNNTHGKLY